MDAIAVDDLRKDLYLQTGSNVKGDYPHWSWDRLNNAPTTSYVTGSAMDAIAVDDLRKDLYLQTGSEMKTGEKTKGDYPHWSWDRLNNAKEISYLTGSAMDAIAVDDLRKDLYV